VGFVVQGSVTVIGILLVSFGVWHHLGPRFFFHWDKHYPHVSALFIDGIRTTNFAASNSFIAMGALDLLMVWFFWSSRDLITLILAIQSITMVARLIYGWINPMRYPNWWGNVAVLGFVSLLCLLNVGSLVLILFLH